MPQLTRRSALGRLVVLLGRARRGLVTRGGGLVVARRGSTGGRREVLLLVVLRRGSLRVSALLVSSLLVPALLLVSALLGVSSVAGCQCCRLVADVTTTLRPASSGGLDGGRQDSGQSSPPSLTHPRC